VTVSTSALPAEVVSISSLNDFRTPLTNPARATISRDVLSPTCSALLSASVATHVAPLRME